MDPALCVDDNLSPGVFSRYLMLSTTHYRVMFQNFSAFSLVAVQAGFLKHQVHSLGVAEMKTETISSFRKSPRSGWRYQEHRCRPFPMLRLSQILTIGQKSKSCRYRIDGGRLLTYSTASLANSSTRSIPVCFSRSSPTSNVTRYRGP